jgi:hypothetical protein
MMELSCGGVAEREAAYVWGALDADERALVDAHRRGCAACERRLRAAAAVIGQLDQALPRVEPPPALRARVLAAIEPLAQPGQPPPPTAGPRRGLVSTVASGTHPGPPPTGATRAGGPERRLGRFRRRPGRLGRFATGAAAGVVATLAAVALAWLLVVRPEALGSIQPAVSGFGSTEPAWPKLVPLPGAGEPAGPARVLELRSPTAPGAGLLVYDADSRRGALLARGLDPSAPRRYSVWLTGDGRRAELGSFEIDDRGAGVFVLPDPLPVSEPRRIEMVGEARAGEQPPVFGADF